MLPLDLLPADLQPNAFIAGGFAACPALAADIDVWVSINGDAAMLDAECARVLAHLRDAAGYVYVEQDGEGSRREQFATHPSMARDQFVTSSFEGYHLSLRIRRVATVWKLGKLPYHIILVNGDVDEVLSSFDISTHQCALTVRGFVTGEQWTPLNEPPLVITQKYTTDERIDRISARYKHFR